MKYPPSDTRIRLLIYSHYFAPSVGGVETSVLSLAKGLSEISALSYGSKFEVTVVTRTPPGGFDDRSLGFQIIRCPSLPELIKIIHDSQAVHLAGPSLLPQFLCFLLGKPVVLEHHGYQSTCPNGLLVRQPERSICSGHYLAGQYLQCLNCQAAEVSTLKAILNLLTMFPRYFLSRFAAANISITDHVRDRQKLPNTTTIYYGIEDQLPSSGTSAQIASAKLCFAYVGRLVQEKGIPVLLEAARLLKETGFEFSVDLVGEGPERSHIEAIIQEKGLQEFVSITGFLQGNSLQNRMAGVAVVVMPSVWEETAGLAAIEQMMRGKPVIASDVGGLAEVVGKSGLLFPVGDSRALADCMKRVIQDPSLVGTLGASARVRAVKLFQRDRMIESHARVYLQILGSCPEVESLPVC